MEYVTFTDWEDIGDILNVEHYQELPGVGANSAVIDANAGAGPLIRESVFKTTSVKKEENFRAYV